MLPSKLPSLLSSLEAVEKEWQHNLRLNPDNDPRPVFIDGCTVEYPADAALWALCRLATGEGAGELSSEERAAFFEAASTLQDRIIDHEYAGGAARLAFVPIVSSTIHDDLDERRDPRAAKGEFHFTNNFHRHSSAPSTTFDHSAMPSAHTTPFARFSSARPPQRQYTSGPPQLRAFAEARCELAGDEHCPPLAMHSAGGLVALSLDYWSSPALEFEHISPIPSATWNRFGKVSLRMGHTGDITHLRVDPGRKLLYSASDGRVKSVYWTFDGDNGKTRPVHTLDSGGYGDAMFLRENGTLLMRSGRKGLAVWDMEAVETHGEDGKRPIGEQMDPEYLEVADDVEVELSHGSKPTLSVTNPAVANMVVVNDHPGRTSEVLAVHRTDKDSQYGVAAVDLGTQQVSMRFLGHSADVNSVASNASSFVTAANDGGVRLYDTRLPTPQFVIRHQTEKLHCALYEDIGGQPFIIFGGSVSEQIKVWDARARKPLYALATGNTMVQHLAWDAPSQTLLAATESVYKDRAGGFHNYRTAKIGAHGEEWVGWAADEDDWEERAWPSRAWHEEKSFGVAWDAGGTYANEVSVQTGRGPASLSGVWAGNGRGELANVVKSVGAQRPEERVQRILQK
ncbi:WD40 repeat-containing protein [Mycena kentingensis (nom. inval.)]|nr:WD40 repeat-containing protein [Mycena kentingensis (nom. inval.)]